MIQGISHVDRVPIMGIGWRQEDQGLGQVVVVLDNPSQVGVRDAALIWSMGIRMCVRVHGLDGNEIMLPCWFILLEPFGVFVFKFRLDY